VITVKTEGMPGSPPNGQKLTQNGPKYDPSIVYVLEFCTVLAIRDEDTIERLGKQVVEALQSVLRDASRYHAITVSRAVFYLLKLLGFSFVSNPSSAASERVNFNREA
jgi:brefeldin A-resistance guanine nucleotide exchange factor 1